MIQPSFHSFTLSLLSDVKWGLIVYAFDFDIDSTKPVLDLEVGWTDPYKRVIGHRKASDHFEMNVLRNIGDLCVKKL